MAQGLVRQSQGDCRQVAQTHGMSDIRLIGFTSAIAQVQIGQGGFIIIFQDFFV